MIKETTSLIIDGNGEKNVTINGGGLSITLKFIEKKQLKDIWVYEQGKYQWSPLSSANYSCEGQLISKFAFSYDENDIMVEFLEFNNENILLGRTVYENDDKGRLKIAYCYDKSENLDYTFEKTWDGDSHICIKTTYKDAAGNEIPERLWNKKIKEE